MTGPKAWLATGLLAVGLAAAAGPGQVPVPAPQQGESPFVKNVVVPASAGWVDTGIDAAAGEELVIRATGEISLQLGNPAAACGPAGLDMLTVDQPVPKENLGALIGKVSQFVASRTDEDTGGEVLDEIFVLFIIGAERTVRVPFKGRLYLGVNEKVVKDNGGEFAAVVTRGPA